MEKIFVKLHTKKPLKQTTHTFIRQNILSTIGDEIQPIILEENEPIINEEQKIRNKQLKKMKPAVSKHSQICTQRQKYKKVKNQLNIVHQYNATKQFSLSENDTVVYIWLTQKMFATNKYN